MTLESIYKDLNNAINDNLDLVKILKLKEKIEQAIRENTCYKTTNKTRVNAIKRVASSDDVRPTLSGYGVYNDYKIITDAYHLIAIKQDNMPLKLVTTDEELIKEHGRENCIIGVYPSMDNIINFNFDKDDTYEIYDNLDLNDMETFYKLHKKDGVENPYHIGKMQCDIRFLKNVIDVLGKEAKIYIPINSDIKPIYIKNDNNELGLVLPIKKW